MGKYGTLGSAFDRIFRNTLNKALDDVDTDITAQKKRVDDLIKGTPQPSEVVDSRGGFPVLRDRLDSLSTDLAESQTKIKPRSISLSGYIATSDASPIIKDLIAQGYMTIYLPDRIRLNTTLNLTDLDGITLVGQGRTEPNGELEAKPTVIELNTGGVAIDIVGSQNMLLKDCLLLDDNCPNPSDVAILQGRSTKNKWAQFNKFDNIKIRMRHDATANNGNGTVGIYNYKSELNTYNNLYVMADKPVVLTVSNIFNILSTFVTHNGEATIKSTAFTGMTALVAKYGNALILDGVTDTTFDHLYMQRYLYNQDNTEEYAILITAPYSTAGVDGSTQVIDYQVNNITISNFENEIFPGFIKIQAKTSNCMFKGQHTHGEGKLVYIPANDASHSNGLTSSHIQINRSKPIVAATQDYIYVEANSNGFHGNMVYMANSKYLVTTLALSHGNIFFGLSQPKLNMFAGSQFMTFGDSGLMLNGRTVGFSFNKPTRTDLPAGSIYFNTNTQFGGVSYWQWDATAWRDCGQIGVRLEATTPVGLRTPYFIGEELFDNVAKRWYKSTGLTNADWVALN